MNPYLLCLWGQGISCMVVQILVENGKDSDHGDILDFLIVTLPLDKGKGGDASLLRGEAPLKGISAVSGHH